AILLALNDLYGISELTDQTYMLLEQKFREANRPGWYKHVLKDRAGIDLSIVDGGHRKFDPEFYRHVERFDQFVQVASASEIRAAAESYLPMVTSLDQYLDALRIAFQAGVDYGMVAVKSGLAYQRIIKYDNIGETRALALFKGMMAEKPLTADDIKAFQDFMMHRVIDLAAEFNLPVQIHTGLQAGNGNLITNSNPVHLVNLFMEHPDVDFCLFHGGYPYGGELATLAKNFPNVFIDMCWIYIISPTYSARYLHEWLETVPANKILAFGGDFQYVEGVYGHAVMAREIITKVLVEKVRSGYFTEAEAIRVAQRILRENALEIFKINGNNRMVEIESVLSKSPFLSQWWELHGSAQGLVRDYRVIGPFPFAEGLDTKYPPEESIDFSGQYPGLAGPVTWRKVQVPESGYLNFLTVFADNPSGVDARAPGMVYAYTEITSPDNRKVKMTLGSNDGATVWINGLSVYNVHVGRNAVKDQVMLDVELKKGVNRILAKVENLGANWGLYLRVVDPSGELAIGCE
ncbi:MAG: hypothetical protein E4H13_13345, partial [Calditrichales bacterium]